MRFGCTYCHSRVGNTAMKEALTHFGLKASKHPVGLNFVGDTETDNEYLSTVGSTTAGEVDCVDCHNPALVDDPGVPSYVGHVAATAATRNPNNPYMLRSVTVAGQYDNLCRGCHGASAPLFKTRDVRVSSHADAVAPIVEDDGTNLVTTTAGGFVQCNACHDSHYSGKVKLFNDGKEAGEAAKAIVSTDCTTVCHYSGDASGSHLTDGHGKAQSTYKYQGGVVDFTAGSNYVTMSYGCTGCHAIIDTSDTSPARKKHVEVPTSGTIQDVYKAKYNLTANLQAWDSGSVYGNPLVGVCFGCHSGYEQHVSRTVGVIGGCQDCHDEHAEGVGVGGNEFMIPQTAKKAGQYASVTTTRAKAGTEAVTYDTTMLNTSTGATARRRIFTRRRRPGPGCATWRSATVVRGTRRWRRT